MSVYETRYYNLSRIKVVRYRKDKWILKRKGWFFWTTVRRKIGWDYSDIIVFNTVSEAMQYAENHVEDIIPPYKIDPPQNSVRLTGKRTIIKNY